MVGDFTSSYCTGQLFQTWKKWGTPMGPQLPPLAPVFQLQGCPRSPQWDVDIPFVSCVAEEAPVRCSAAKMLKATKHKWCWSWSWNTHVLKKISYSTTKKNEKKQKKQNTSFIQLATDSCYTFQPSDGSWCQGTASSITLWLSFTSFTAGTASEAAGATEVKRSTCKRRSLVLWIIFRVSLVWFII